MRARAHPSSAAVSSSLSPLPPLTSSGWNWNGSFSLIISQCLSRMPGLRRAMMSGRSGRNASSSFLMAEAMARHPGLSLIALLLMHLAIVLL